VSGTPARGLPSLEDEQLLALARTLPEPVLSDARREEMRTAFLATARGLRSGSRGLAVAKRRRRLLLIGTIVFAGAGAAAAAWRINRPSLSAGRQPPQNLAVSAGATSPRLLAAPAETDPAAPSKSSERPGAPARKLAVVGHRAPAETPPGNEAEIAFARGWSALRTGDFSIAAEAFGRVSSGKDSAHNALAEDALFWRGVALDRAGRFEPARQVLATFLARYPDSDRQGEASVILGWLLVRAGDLGDARVHFTGALQDPAERVRSSARAGLTAAQDAGP
jgi:TolA-binding protein